MFHLFHKWKITSVQEMTRKALYFGVVINPELPGEPCTAILEVCKICGTSRSRSIGGVWTMNDLVGGT